LSTESVKIEFDFLVPGLNGDKGLMRLHFRSWKKVKKTYQLIIRSQTKKKLKGRVRVVWERRTTTLMDWDNHCASFKFVGDALVLAGVISDDKPAVISEFIPKQTKVSKRSDCKMILTITEI